MQVASPTGSPLPLVNLQGAAAEMWGRCCDVKPQLLLAMPVDPVKHREPRNARLIWDMFRHCCLVSSSS